MSGEVEQYIMGKYTIAFFEYLILFFECVRTIEKEAIRFRIIIKRERLVMIRVVEFVWHF